MITLKHFRTTRQHRAFCVRWHRQSGWRMDHTSTRRMQQNTRRWYCLHQRARRERLMTWARRERDGYAVCIEARNRLPSNNDLPRSFVHWHCANVYARVGMGEDRERVITEEEAALLVKIRAYNTAQEKFTHTWHGCAGYYGEDEAKTKMQHVRTMIINNL